MVKFGTLFRSGLPNIGDGSTHAHVQLTAGALCRSAPSLRSLQLVECIKGHMSSSSASEMMMAASAPVCALRTMAPRWA